MRLVNLLSGLITALVFIVIGIITYADTKPSFASYTSEIPLEYLEVNYEPNPAPYFDIKQEIENVIAKEVLTIDDAELECLALNIYHEARNESTLGQRAVAWVTLNRVNSSQFPNTICEVVKQGVHSQWYREQLGKDVPLRNKCQFSWYCDGRDDTPRNRAVWQETRILAQEVYNNYYRNLRSDPTHGALWYHADYVSPYWRKAYTELVAIDSHIFYGE